MITPARKKTSLEDQTEYREYCQTVLVLFSIQLTVG